MKFVVQAMLGLSLAVAAPAFAAVPASPSQSAAPNAAHVKAVQDLLGAMQVEKLMRGVVARTRYPSEAQRQALSAKFEKTPPAEIYQRLAAPMARIISADTATEMTMFPGAKPVVPPEEKKERKRAAYVKASKELADAEPWIEREAFKLLQAMSKEKR